MKRKKRKNGKGRKKYGSHRHGDTIRRSEYVPVPYNVQYSITFSCHPCVLIQRPGHAKQRAFSRTEYFA